MVGSFRYLAPERFAWSREPEPPSNVFALGCVLFEAMTGARLFGDFDLPGLMGLMSRRPSSTPTCAPGSTR